MTHEELRTQFNNETFKGMLRYTLGESCYNCGSDLNVEYHHVVPLKLGGTNRISNIVPLCNKCHKAAHRGQHISKYQNTERTGRPRKKLPNNYKEILRRYVYGEIGKTECQALLGIGSKKGGHAINKNKYYREYLAEMGIQSHRNNVDLHNSIGRGSGLVAEIYYTDGRKETIYEGGEIE